MTRKVVSPIALDKSINTTEQTPRNIADVLAQQLAAIKTAIESGNGNLEAAFVCYYGVTTATQIKDAIEDGKVPYFYYNGVVAQLWKVETNKYTFRTTNTRSVEGQTILDVVDYVVNGSVWSTVTREVSGGSSSGQSYIATVKSLADFDTTGYSGMHSVLSVDNVPADGIYQLSVMLHITPKTASATKSDLVFHFTSGDGAGWPNHTFHAVVDDSQTFAQQLSFSTSVSLKAGQNTLRIQCGGLNTEYLVFVDELTLAQLVNGVYHNGDDFDEVHTLPEAADFNNDDGVLVDGATGGPRFMLWRTLANKVLGFIKNLSTTITAFRTGDVIPVDGPSGTAKMSKDDLLRVTAENAIEKLPDVLGLCSIGSSILGYIGMQGGDIKIITSSGNKWRHFVCKVDVGKEYVVRTILGSGTTYIAEGDTATQTTGFTPLVQNTSDPTNLKDYIVTPTKPYLFITYRVPDDLGDPWTQNDYKCFVIEKVKYTNTIAEEIDDLQDEDKRKTSILGEYDIGSSALGYIGLQNDVVKIISNAGNKWRHFVCKVDVGNQYVVRTILGSGSSYIAEGDTSTQTTGFSPLVQNTSDPTNLKNYVVTPSKPYLFITYRVPNDLGDPWTQNDYKCFVVNAKNYASESAEYTKTIILSQDSSTPINITQNTIVYGNGHHVNLGTELSLEFTEDIGEALYTASVDGDVYRCFVTQELPLSVSGDRPYYQVTLWAIDDNDVSNSIILTPKLTTTEVNNTTNSFTYDGTKFVVNVPNHSNYTRFVLNQDGNDGCCLICNGYKVRCYDVVFEFASFECAHVEGSRYCEFVNCEFAYPKAYNSLQTKDVQNVVLRNCTAHHANNDGFSVGYSGTILMEDCTGSYNQDDGVSNHGNRGETRFVIRGGEYHHNHKGGISSPVYGSVGDIHEVLLHDNHYGVYATNPTDGRTRYYKQTNKISGCHIYDNTVGIYASEYKLITWSNVLNNTTDYEEVNGGVIVR